MIARLWPLFPFFFFFFNCNQLLLASSGYGDCQQYPCISSTILGTIDLPWCCCFQEHTVQESWLVFLVYNICCRWTIIFKQCYRYYYKNCGEIFCLLLFDVRDHISSFAYSKQLIIGYEKTTVWSFVIEYFSRLSRLVQEKTLFSKKCFCRFWITIKLPLA